MGAASRQAVADACALGAASREAATRSAKARADWGRLGTGAHSGSGLTLVWQPAAAGGGGGGASPLEGQAGSSERRALWPCLVVSVG